MPREVLYVLVLMAAVGHAVWNALIKDPATAFL